MSLKDTLFKWLFKDQIKELEDAEEDIAELKEVYNSHSYNTDNSNKENGVDYILFDEFGCERKSGESFSIDPNSETKYIVDPVSHKLIPYAIVESAMRKTGYYKKHNLKEDFTSADVTNEIMNDFMGFYGGSSLTNNYFEWNFQKQRLMFERSHEECQKGIGKAIKDITTNFVLGDGVGFEYTDIKVEDPELRERIYSVLWKIWQDNAFDLKQYTISDFAVERGEVFVKISQDKSKGIFDVEVIDPWEITDYLYDPNTRKVKAWFRDYYRNGAPVTQEPLLVEGGIDPYTKIPYELHHYKFNVTDTIVRGRSDIYSVLYWIKIYNDFLKCRSRVNRFRSSVAWHKQIAGGTKSISAGVTKVQKPFPPGVVIVSDDKTTFKAVDAKIQAGDVKDDGDSFKIIIASATQIPHHWLFGSGENTNLATAKNMSAVPKRKFLRRQKDIKTILQTIFWKGLKFYLDGKDKPLEENSIISEKKNLSILKEEIDSFSKSKNSSSKEEHREEEFIIEGALIKKKYLEISIPNIDEHNSEDLLRLVNAAKNLRAAGIGSNSALYQMVGLNYRRDREVSETEWKRGDYEIARSIHRIFNNFKNDDGTDLASPNLDKNKDGVVDKTEEPKDSSLDDVTSTLNASKSARGGG